MTNNGQSSESFDERWRALRDTGDIVGALRVAREHLSLARQSISSDSDELDQAFFIVHYLSMRAELYNDACSIGEEWVEHTEQIFGRVHRRVASASLYHGASLVELGRDVEAEIAYKKIIYVYDNLPGRSYHNELIANLEMLGDTQTRLEKCDEAECTYRRKLELLLEHASHAGLDISTMQAKIASLYIGQERFTDAESLLVDSLGMIENKFGPMSGYLAKLYERLAEIYDSTNRLELGRSAKLRSVLINEKHA